MPYVNDVIKLLDQRTVQFIRSGAIEGERNESLYHSSQQCCWNGLSIDEAEQVLLSPGLECGLKEHEIKTTIRSAYRTKGTMFPRVIEYYQSHNITPKIHHEQDHYTFRQWAESVFLPGDNIFLAPADAPYQHTIVPRDKLIEMHESGKLPVASTEGVYCTCNPISGDRRWDQNVTAFRHAIVEFDNLPIEQQWEKVSESKLPVKAAIYSGRKSVHFWVEVGAKDIEEYRSRCNVISELLPECDKKLLHPGCWTRLPEVSRGESRQVIQKLSFGCLSWDDWINRDEDPSEKTIDAENWINSVQEVEPSELITGILHKGCRMILGGASKSRKSWALLDMAISIASGTNWMGFPCLKSKVLLVNMEIHKAFLQSRIKAIMKAKGITTKDISGHLYIQHRRGMPAPADEVAKLIHRKAHQLGDVSCVIIDPIYKTLNGLDENKAGDIGLLMNVFDRMSAADDIAVVFAAHFAKGDANAREAIDRVSGSGVFARDPDTFLTVTKYVEVFKKGRRVIKQEIKDIFCVDCHLRHHPEIDMTHIQWEYPLFHRISLPDAEKPVEATDLLPDVKRDDYKPILNLPAKSDDVVALPSKFNSAESFALSLVSPVGIERKAMLEAMSGQGISNDRTKRLIQKLIAANYLAYFDSDSSIIIRGKSYELYSEKR